MHTSSRCFVLLELIMSVTMSTDHLQTKDGIVSTISQ